MEVVVLGSAGDVAVRAADMICAAIRRKPNLVLGLATGSTPLALYRELIRRHKDEGLSFRLVRSFNLDEYVGLTPDNPQSYRYFMNKNLFEHIDIDLVNTHVPDGACPNPLDVGPRYELDIQLAGGIDLQVLGLGANGHIGFNEPTSSLGSRTRVKTLTEQTVRDNSRFFRPDEFQPRLAITMGMQTILNSRQIVLLATGESKARAVADAVEGPIAAACPASALQMHPKTSFLIDAAASAELKMRSYYEWVRQQQDALMATHGDK